MAAASLPTNWNPTLTIAALALRSVAAIRLNLQSAI